MDKRILYIWLNNIRGIGPIIGNRLIKELGSIENVYSATFEEIQRVQGIGKKLARDIMNDKSLDVSKSILSECIKNNIGISIREDASYPIVLRSYNDAPSLLYYKGNIEKINKPIAIIGTKNCDSYGKRVCIDIVNNLSQNKIQVISGLAKGIDSYVHTISVNNNNFNIGVVGTGIDICYPKEHKKLQEKIIENGVIISQFKLGTSNIKANFLKRNNLIAMLSEQIIVIQGEKESGALYAGECGIKLNKEVLAVPGEMFNDLSYAPNQLLKMGVKIYENSLVNKSDMTLLKKHEKLFSLIKEKAYYKEELVQVLGIESCILEDEILELELKGMILQKGGKYIVASPGIEQEDMK
ncbi:MAG: DNA-processing protein DprA [Sarcina sp.]